MENVLLVSSVLVSGGISRFSKDLLAARLNYEIQLYNTARPPKPSTIKGAIGYNTILAGGVKIMVRNAVITSLNILRFPFHLLRSKASLVHLATSSHWSFWEYSAYLFLAKILRFPVFLHFLGDFISFYENANVTEKKIIQWVFISADGIVVLSENVRQMVIPFIKAKKIWVVPSFISSGAPYFRLKNFQNSTESLVVLFLAGNYGVRKGVKDLMLSIPRVISACKDVKFYLIGGGDVRAAFENFMDNSKNHVKYFGLVDEDTKLQLFSEANIFVLPSYSEGLPYGIIEAMAAGLPIVATNIGGIPEVVTHGENGFLFKPGDIDALVKNIKIFVNNPSLIHLMGEANQQKVLKQFTSTNAFEVIERVYDTLLSERAGAKALQ
jgi:glycosyltransferase involved in cell wall biosynthesis